MNRYKIKVSTGRSGSSIAIHSKSQPPDLVAVDPAITLTKDQQQTAILIAEGWNNEKIAQLLYVSEGALLCRLTKLFRLLGVKNRVELMACLKNNPQLLVVPVFKNAAATRREISFLRQQRLKAALLLTELMRKTKGSFKNNLQEVLDLLQPELSNF